MVGIMPFYVCTCLTDRWGRNLRMEIIMSMVLVADPERDVAVGLGVKQMPEMAGVPGTQDDEEGSRIEDLEVASVDAADIRISDHRYAFLYWDLEVLILV